MRNKYNAFISYKHGAGTGYAVPLKRAIQRYAKFFLSPSRKIFRDEEYLKPGIDLPAMIRTSLENAEFFILLASPEAAKSQWVEDEIHEWCSKPARISNLIIVLTAGDISVDINVKAIDWKNTSALPRLLKDYLTSVPLYVDLSWSQSPSQFNLQDPRFKNAVNAIVAKIDNRDPHAMLGVQMDAFRRNRRLTVAFGALIILLAVLAGIGAWMTSITNTKLISSNRDLDASYTAALSESMVARDPTIAYRLAERAHSLKPTFSSTKTLFQVYNSNALFYSHMYRDVRDADLHPSGERALIISGVYYPQVVQVISLRDNNSVILETGDKEINGGRFVLTGSHVLTWASDGLFSLYRLDGSKVAEIETSMDELSTISFDVGRDTVVGGAFGNVHIWELGKQKHLKVDVSISEDEEIFAHSGRLTVICSPTEREFAEYRYSENAVRVWGFDGIRKYKLESDCCVSGIKYSPDGTLIVVSTGKSASIWKAGKKLATITSHVRDIYSLEFTRDGRFLITTSLDGKSLLHAVDRFLDSIEAPARKLAKSDRVSDVVSGSTNSDLVAFARRNGVISIYDLTGVVQHQLVGHKAGDEANRSLERLIWSEHDKIVMTVAREDLTARIWSMNTGRFRLLRNSESKRYGNIEFSRDQETVAAYVASKQGHYVELLDLNGKLIRTLSGHQSFIRTTLFGDEDVIVTHSNDRIQIWDRGSDPIVIEASPVGYFTGELKFGNSDSTLILIDNIGQGDIQGAWTIQGEPIELSTPPNFAENSDNVNLEDGTLGGIEWMRLEGGWGYVVYDNSKGDQTFVKTELGAAYVVNSELNKFNYACAQGEHGVELFLFDAARILKLLGRLHVNREIWPLDEEEQKRLGVGQLSRDNKSFQRAAQFGR